MKPIQELSNLSVIFGIASVLEGILFFESVKAKLIYFAFISLVGTAIMLVLFTITVSYWAEERAKRKLLLKITIKSAIATESIVLTDSSVKDALLDLFGNYTVQEVVDLFAKYGNFDAYVSDWFFRRKQPDAVVRTMYLTLKKHKLLKKVNMTREDIEPLAPYRAAHRRAFES